MYNGTEDPFILNFNWLTVPSPLSLPTLSLSLSSLEIQNFNSKFILNIKHSKIQFEMLNSKNPSGLIPQKSGLCKTWNIGFEYWNMFARAVERKIEWWLMIWVKQHSFQYCSFCLFCNCQEIPSFFFSTSWLVCTENSKILSSYLFFSIWWLLLTGNSGTSSLFFSGLKKSSRAWETQANKKCLVTNKKRLFVKKSYF